MREIITKEDLIHDDVRKEVNIILTSLFKRKRKQLSAMLEETAEVNSPLTYGYHHGGIDSVYWFSTHFGTVQAYIGDDSYKVTFLENMVLKLVKK